MTSSSQTVIDHYRIGDLIGRGGMSDVYRGEDLLTGGQVAIKIVRSGDPNLARRLVQEALALKRFDHPALVRVLDSGVSDDQPYLVMELVDGVTLAELLRSGARTPGQTATLGASLASALAYVHELGIVHRDVKPSNILIPTSGPAKLADFGIARMIDDPGLTVTGTTVGTTSYMAPEQLEDHQVGPAADVWSLGIVLIECLTGKRVYEGTPSEVVAHRLAGPIPIPEALPTPWRLLFAGMLDHEPSRRLSPSDVAELLSADPFTAEWNPAVAIDTALLMPTQAHDLTALLPNDALGKTSVIANDTLVEAVAPISMAARLAWLRKSKWFIAALAVIIVAAFALLSSNNTKASKLPSNSTRQTTSSTSTTSSTTTTVLTPAQALANLVRDVSTGVTSGTVPSSMGLQISNLAEQAVSDAAAGNPSAATNDLQQVATIIANGSSSGVITPTEAATLQSDLVALATTLGLSGAATAPTTTQAPTTPQAPAPAPGNGKGKGH